MDSKQVKTTPFSVPFQNLFSSIEGCKNELISFENQLHSNFSTIKQIKRKCKDFVLKSINELKGAFEQFASEWKNDIPSICFEFLSIFEKTSEAYQRKIKKLEEENQKWEFSYQQLLQAFKKNQKEGKREKEVVSDLIEKQMQKSILQQEMSSLFEKESINGRPLKEKKSQLSLQLKSSTKIDKQNFWSNLNHQVPLQKQNSKKPDRSQQSSKQRHMLNLRKHLYRQRNSCDWRN